MNSFVETRYSVLQGVGSEGGPGFLTFIGMGHSAFERRIVDWDQVKARYNLATGLRDATDIATLRAIFLACRGRAMGFRYKDLADFQATDSPIGTGDGSNKIFRLKKRYTLGSNIYDRRCFKSVAGTVTTKVNGVPNAAFSIDHTTGTITYSAAPANGHSVTASFQFDVPVRFDTDELKMSPEDWDQGVVGELPVVELRFED